jgi:hypothetical protein
MIVIFENLDINQQIALISAGAALLGAIIGAFATLAATWLTKKVQSSGKVSLYAKIVHTKGKINRSWGYYRSGSKPGLYMLVPIWLDVCNTCGVSRIIRNVNLYAYAGKDEVAAFTQIQRFGDGEEEILLGNNESYTLVISSNSACRFNLSFMLYEHELPPDKKAFDELILTYFDEKNNVKAFHFVKPSHCWVEGALSNEKQWITLDNKCSYAR